MSDKNVAIVIAVSEYRNASPLPACKTDGALVKDILLATGRFNKDNMFFVDSETESGKIKTNLSRFIEDHLAKQSEIDELIFYFSGHGTFDGDFFFVLTDYDSKKLNQTCLSNSELDGLLRSLNPKLAVKIVDACESGTSYIKAPDDIQKTIKRTEASFAKCYFMFSSQQEQKSGLDERLSYFTRSFARSLQSYDRPIRYQDVIAFITDEFKDNPNQQPFFVIQARNTEIFAEPTPSLKKLLETHSALLSPSGLVASDRIAFSETATASVIPAPALTITDQVRQRIEQEEKMYCTEVEADRAFGEIQKSVTSATYPAMLNDYFSVHASFSQTYDSIPSTLQIARWLEGKKGEYFASLQYRSRLSDILPSFLGQPNYVNELVGFDNTNEHSPYRSIEIVAEPQRLNLPMWKCFIALITSRTEMRGFITFIKYVDKNWNERQATGKVEWRTQGFPLKKTNEAISFVNEILRDFAQVVEKDLIERYNLS